MNRISKAQFTALILIGDTFMLFCLRGGISAVTALGTAVGIAVQFLAVIPLIMTLRNGKTLKDCGKTAEAAVLVCTILQGGALFSMLWSTGEIIYIPYENSGIWGHLLIAGLIAVVCVYISSSGIKALARSGALAAAVGAICIVVVTVSAAINSEPENLLISGERDFLAELLRGLSLSGGLGSFAVLLSFTNGSPFKASMWYFGIKAVVTTVVILTGVLVTGGIMEITDFPIASAAQLSQPFPIQRIDSLFLIVFSVFAVYAIGVQASAAENLLADVIPAIKKYRCSLMLGAMAASGAVMGGRLNSGIPSIAAAAVLIIVPSMYWAEKYFRRTSLQTAKERS